MPSETLLLLILIIVQLCMVYFFPQEVDFHSKILSGLVYCRIFIVYQKYLKINVSLLASEVEICKV